MAFKPYDFNYPIMDNRDEVMLIKTYGGLKNISEVIFYTMIVTIGGSHGLWEERYPGIRDVRALKEPKTIYDFTSHYNLERFMIFLRNPKPELPLQEIYNDIAELMGKINPKAGSMNSLELGIYNLIDQDFVKKLYVCDLGGRTKQYNEYISQLFKGHEQKVFMVEDHLKNVIDQYPDITTIFADNVDEVMEYMEYCEGAGETAKLENKQFYIMAAPSYGKTENGDLVLMYSDYFEDCPKRFKCKVTWINSHYIDPNDHNPGVIL